MSRKATRARRVTQKRKTTTHATARQLAARRKFRDAVRRFGRIRKGTKL